MIIAIIAVAALLLLTVAHLNYLLGLPRREREAAEAAKQASVKASAAALETYRATKGGVPVEAAPLEDVDELKAKLAELERQVSAQPESFRRLDQITGGEE